MKIKRVLVIAFSLLTVAAFAFAYYQYNKPKPDIAGLDAKQVTAVSLFKDYNANETNANKLYLNKPVEVSGKVLEVKQSPDKQVQVILDAGDPMFGIACSVNNSTKIVRSGDLVTIKGICSGFLNDVVLVNSIVLK